MAALIGLLCSTLLCNKWRVVKNERKENGSSFLSVNIKDTAGCSVLIKQVSVHKQLINKRRPSPPPDVFACLFHFTTGQCYTTAPPEWPQVFIMRTAAAATGTMTQLWHSLTRHGLVFRATFGVSWHISGTDSAHGKNLTRSFLITATLLSACRMWCHHTDGFFGNTSVLMAVISYVLTQLCFIQSVTFQHRINISGTTSTHTSSVVNSSCLSVCLSAGSFHLIHLMFDDYVLYLLESLHCQERANDLMRAMKGDGSTGETATLSLITLVPAQELWGFALFYVKIK